MLSGLKCILPTSQSLTPLAHPFLIRIDLALSGCDIRLSDRELFCGTLSKHRRLVGGHLCFGPTKNHRSRIVPIPGFPSELFADHLDRHVPDDPEALVLTTPTGTPLRDSNFRRQIWYEVVEEAELPQGLRIHNLRHTYAGLLAAADSNPKAVQVHLGHSSITVTMDRYTHLFPSDVDNLVR